MEEKLAQLTKTLYQEGVEKGEEEAKRVVDEANQRAAKIIEDAKKKAAGIVEEAKSEAEELKRNTTSEIKLSGQQALSTIKQQILDLVTAKVIDESLAKALSSPEVIKDFVKIVVQNWKVGEGETPSMELLVPEDKREELEKAFKAGLGGLLNKGLTVSFARGVKGGFQIGPEGSTYKISMTDGDFSEFFKEYLRPRTRQYLFGE
jgi:V/A-type H+-transporting ATPase subunit E